jgi:hypothetical protein
VLCCSCFSDMVHHLSEFPDWSLSYPGVLCRFPAENGSARFFSEGSTPEGWQFADLCTDACGRGKVSLMQIAAFLKVRPCIKLQPYP